eukprot:gene17820-18047_t
MDYPNSVLQFSWICTYSTPSFGSSCPLINSGNSSIVYASSSSPSTITVTVYVTNSFHQISNASVVINFVADTYPLVTVTGLSPLVSGNSKLVISGAVVSSNAVTATWSSSSINTGTLLFIHFEHWKRQFQPLRDSGIALNTSFSLVTTLWTSDLSSYPLVYSFSYYSVDINTQYLIRSNAAQPYVSAFLGQGSSGANYAL